MCWGLDSKNTYANCSWIFPIYGDYDRGTVRIDLSQFINVRCLVHITSLWVALLFINWWSPKQWEAHPCHMKLRNGRKDQWEFQDPKMEVCTIFQAIFLGIFPYIGLKNRPVKRACLRHQIYGRCLVLELFISWCLFWGFFMYSLVN